MEVYFFLLLIGWLEDRKLQFHAPIGDLLKEYLSKIFMIFSEAVCMCPKGVFVVFILRTRLDYRNCSREFCLEYKITLEMQI